MNLESTSVRATAFATQAADRLGPVYSNASTIDSMSKIHDECNKMSDELVHLLQTKPKHNWLQAFRGTMTPTSVLCFSIPQAKVEEFSLPVEPSVLEGATAALPATPTRTWLLTTCGKPWKFRLHYRQRVIDVPQNRLGLSVELQLDISRVYHTWTPPGQEDHHILSENSISLEVDYSTARFVCKAGSNGTGAEQFNKPCSIACMKDRIFVTDEENHRVKVYSHDLDLLFHIWRKRFKEKWTSPTLPVLQSVLTIEFTSATATIIKSKYMLHMVNSSEHLAPKARMYTNWTNLMA